MFLEVFIFALLAGISPGPDFFIVTKNAIGYGKKVGIASSIGISAALSIHAAYSILGLALIMQHYHLLFVIIQLVGAAYLGYLGIATLVSLFTARKGETGGHDDLIPSKSFAQGFLNGFLCNMLNPKAYVFFLSVFSQFMSPTTPFWVEWIYGLEVVLTVGAWFVVVSLLISARVFKQTYMRARIWIEGAFGAILVFFAIKIGQAALTGK